MCNGTFNSFTLRMEKSTDANKSIMYLLAFWREVGHNTPYGNPCHRSRRRASHPGSTHTYREMCQTCKKIRCNLHNTSKQHSAVKVSEHKQRSDTIKAVNRNWAKAISAFEKNLQHSSLNLTGTACFAFDALPSQGLDICSQISGELQAWWMAFKEKCGIKQTGFREKVSKHAQLKERHYLIL